MNALFDRIEEAASAIGKSITVTPRVGIILGTGLGNLARQIEGAQSIAYSEIPHFPESTVASHAGQFIGGTLCGVPVVAMEGRFHLYEGYTLDQVTFPVRVMKQLGIELLVVTNACGGLNHLHEKGDICIIEDHINLMGVNPLIGPNDDRLGPRFPDMWQPYDPALIAQTERVALKEGIRVQRGVYAAMTGPCLETRAEYRMLKTLGADTIGMSTVPEVIVAVHAGLKVLGMSVITDICLADALEPVNIDEIIAVANESGPKLETLLTGVLQGL
ncbi:MAG: purine-nucleoside phosphorylase [Planctomycetota bacterium]|jgi:purine-nucleoside phosphorylase